jgi:hypothetical protein
MFPRLWGFMRTLEFSISVQVDDGLSEESLKDLCSEMQRYLWHRLANAEIDDVRIRGTDISLIGWVARKQPAAPSS